MSDKRNEALGVCVKQNGVWRRKDMCVFLTRHGVGNLALPREVGGRTHLPLFVERSRQHLWDYSS